MNKNKNNNIKLLTKNSKVALLKDRATQKSKRQKNKANFYYSFLTVVLLICLIQIGFSAILNVSKAIAYNSKITTMKELRNEADKRNKQLKYELSNFSKTSNLEAMARNNLKMASEDEVLVIISNEDKKMQSKNKKYINFKRDKNDKQ